MDSKETLKTVGGISGNDLKIIVDTFKLHSEIQSAILYGSRAKGNNKEYSDVDIAIKGDAVDSNTVFHIHEMLNEIVPLPWFFDIIIYDKITNENLKNHIDSIGIEIYHAN